jgi:hypothetical protein
MSCPSCEYEAYNGSYEPCLNCARMAPWDPLESSLHRAIAAAMRNAQSTSLSGLARAVSVIDWLDLAINSHPYPPAGNCYMDDSYLGNTSSITHPPHQGLPWGSSYLTHSSPYTLRPDAKPFIYSANGAVNHLPASLSTINNRPLSNTKEKSHHGLTYLSSKTLTGSTNTLQILRLTSTAASKDRVLPTLM